jgi:hypothetical protein
VHCGTSDLLRPSFTPLARSQTDIGHLPTALVGQIAHWLFLCPGVRVKSDGFAVLGFGGGRDRKPAAVTNAINGLTGFLRSRLLSRAFYKDTIFEEEGASGKALTVAEPSYQTNDWNSIGTPRIRLTGL